MQRCRIRTRSRPCPATSATSRLTSAIPSFAGPAPLAGGSAGYNYYRDDKSAYGCVQIANRFSDCVPSIPNSTLGITESNKWNSFRVGVNGAVKVMDGWTLTADAAYLPFVRFTGVDNHLLRTDVSNTVSPEAGP